ncbi:hypothetical protein RB195_015495 [Necator americanus]|uniref:Uncharacterized protein n=1 Tax=Necator americanus TaxID=51031 RepID=A0ABR1E4V8_NECAM
MRIGSVLVALEYSRSPTSDARVMEDSKVVARYDRESPAFVLNFLSDDYLIFSEVFTEGGKMPSIAAILINAYRFNVTRIGGEQWQGN